jgi:hypothetical protein
MMTKIASASNQNHFRFMPGIVRLASDAEQARARYPGLLAKPRRRPLARPNYRQYHGGMTESEWRNCTDPAPMLEFLLDSGKAGERKLRLFAVACCRRNWDLLSDPRSRRAVEVAEEFCDGIASQEETQEAPPGQVQCPP